MNPGIWPKLIILLLTLATTSCTSCISIDINSSFFDSEASKHVSKPLESNIESISIDNRHGQVTIKSTEHSWAWGWSATAKAHSLEEAEKHLNHIIMEVSHNETHQSWKLNYPKHNSDFSFESDITLHVPKHVRVVLTNQFGPVTIHDVNGNLIVDNKHGSVNIKNNNDFCSVTNSFGSVHLKNIKSIEVNNKHGCVIAESIHGDTLINTSFARTSVNNISGNLKVINKHGSVQVSNAQKNIYLKTSFSSINLHALGDEISCFNKHGKINIQATNPHLKKLTAHTTFGPINLTLPDNPFHIEADTSFGKIKSDFQVLRSDTGFSNSVATSENNKGFISLKTSHGNIEIKKDKTIYH